MLVASGIVIFWVLLIALTIFSWDRGRGVTNTSQLSCSVVVPYRNEAANLPALVRAIQGQKLERFEVIFVNDHSTDNSEKVLLKTLKGTDFSYRLLSLTEAEGKKAALTLGIVKASYDLIITTDADCQMESRWLESMISCFADDQVNLATGPVCLSGQQMIQRFQRLEMLALMGATAATIKLGKPTMANGANLGFRKAVFKELNGYEGIDAIPSGDDELFMQKVQRKSPGSIRFNKDVKAKVTTMAETSLREMITQKRRWSGKWKVNKRWSTVMLALFVFAVNLAQLVLAADVIANTFNAWLSLLSLLLKFMAELFLILQVRFDLRERIRLPDFMLSFIFYPFYTLFIGLAANFGSYKWKGRKYS